MVSPRASSCGSPTASSLATVVSLSGASVSTRTIRPGCSACAERTNPHTAAPARSATSSPGDPTAPCVWTTNTPVPSPASHDCNTPKASCTAAYTEPTSAPEPGSHTTTPSPTPLPPNGTGDQATS